MVAYPGLDHLTSDQARRLAAEYSGAWTVVSRQETVLDEPPPPPYTTAALLEDAARRLGWDAARTMQTAQQLFEEGWITYPRTDSTRVTPQAVQEARLAVAREYGAHLLGETVPQPSDPGERFPQRAHEAIRPTDVSRPPDAVPDPHAQALYRLIRLRFLAAFMRPARVRVVALTLEKEDDSDVRSARVHYVQHRLRVTGSDLQQHASGAARAAAPLLPVLQSAHADSQQRRELTLRKVHSLPDGLHVQVCAAERPGRRALSSQNRPALTHALEQFFEKFVVHSATFLVGRIRHRRISVKDVHIISLKSPPDRLPITSGT